MPDAPERPGTVMFVAIVLFVFGAVYTLSACATGGQAGYIAFFSEPPDPRAKVRPDDVAANLRFLADEIPGYVAIVIGVAVLDILFGIAQLICGIGVLKVKPAARTATMVLILLRLVYVLVFDAFSAVMMYPVQIRFYELHPLEIPQHAGPRPVDMATIMRVTLYVGLALKVFVELFVAALIVWLLNTAKAKAAFAGTLEPPPEEVEKPRSAYVGYEDDEQTS